MIGNFFQSLDRHGVEHLLISGQASVLYGAATFSEDIDLWVNPKPEGCLRLADALRECGAHYYKLSPVLGLEHMVRGHGFHFLLSGEIFVDVMGVPPRVGSFASATRSACRMDTEWGRLHTIGLKDLVELKKTQRLEDYSVISNLAVAWFRRIETASIRRKADAGGGSGLTKLTKPLADCPIALVTTAGVARRDDVHLPASDLLMKAEAPSLPAADRGSGCCRP